jgi:hypothetical protein
MEALSLCAGNDHIDPLTPAIVADDRACHFGMVISAFPCRAASRMRIGSAI